ncbi:MAG: penicillin-binding protein 2 [Hyphomicrobiales bacterium]|nr:penicillin-binding protein 2 [Hyphomicrobiales bacterium]
MSAVGSQLNPSSKARPAEFGDHGGRALETSRDRLLAAGLVFVFAFFIICLRLVDLAALNGGTEGRTHLARFEQAGGRGDVVDRNGVLVATSLRTASLYADPHEIIDPRAAAQGLAGVFPDLDKRELLDRLSRQGRFVWIRRNLTPEEQYAVNKLGIPGLAFQSEYSRVYPLGRSAAHVLGLTDVDENGVAGLERSFGPVLDHGETVRLSLDMRVQHLLREELARAKDTYSAIGAAGVVLDVNSGEVLSLVSLPDYNPNAPRELSADAQFNRATMGVYELGSVFKLFTAAMALDTGVAGLGDGYDATEPLFVAHHRISDYHAKKRWLSIPEIIVYSSNIGAALMAEDVGRDAQRHYLKRLGLLDAADIDLPEVGSPLLPHPWRDINTMTVGFGHGIAVSPLQLASAVAAVVNGGVYRSPSILKRHIGPAATERHVFSKRTSRQIRGLMRLVVQHGTGVRADVPGYQVGGKTGTAEKLVDGRYQRDRRVSSFVGAFPMDKPQYVVLAVLDEPKGTKETYNYATGGWVAAPAVGRVIERMAPLLGISPTHEAPDVQEAALTEKEKDQRLARAIQMMIANDKDWRIAAN